jgi:hypothetical protein
MGATTDALAERPARAERQLADEARRCAQRIATDLLLGDGVEPGSLRLRR